MRRSQGDRSTSQDRAGQGGRSENSRVEAAAMVAPVEHDDAELPPRSPPQVATSSTNNALSQDLIDRRSADGARVPLSEDLSRQDNVARMATAQPPQDRTPQVAITQSARASSKTRDRGYSLRRSLFTQNMHKQNEGHGSVMEMVQPSSSQQRLARVQETGEKGPAVIDIGQAGEQAPSRLADSHLSGKDHPFDQPIHSRWTKQQNKSFRGLRNVFGSLKALRDRLFGSTEIPHTVDGRHVRVSTSRGQHPLDERTGKPYVGNKIRSCKYTLWNFFPKQLVAQFGKLANFYFLIVSIMQMIPGLSTTGTYTTISKLAFPSAFK